MYSFQKIKIIDTAEKLFIEAKSQDNVTSNIDLAKYSFHASVAFHTIADRFYRRECLTDPKPDDNIPSADIRHP